MVFAAWAFKFAPAPNHALSSRLLCRRPTSQSMYCVVAFSAPQAVPLMASWPLPFCPPWNKSMIRR